MRKKFLIGTMTFMLCISSLCGCSINKNEDVKRSLESGMNAHMSKPINIRKLEEILSNIWDK